MNSTLLTRTRLGRPVQIAKRMFAICVGLVFSVNTTVAQNSYNMCNATVTNDADGILYDSGGPTGNYGNGENCGFLISPNVPAGACLAEIILDFTNFSTENNWDGVRVHDGNDDTAPGLHPNNGPWNSGLGPGFTGNLAPFSLTTTSGEAFIRFVSDGSVPFPGFTMEWSSTLLFPINADFIVPDSLFTGQTYTFRNANQNAGFDHEWDMDADGTVDGTGTDFTTTFNNPGTFDLKLVTSTTKCPFPADSITKQIRIVNPTAAPVADFVADQNNINVFESVTLTDLSSNGPIQWTWSVQPATGWFAVGTLNDPELELFFIEEGEYTVCLVSENIIGPSAQVCKTSYINVDPPLNNSLCFQTGSTRSFGNLFDSGGPTGNFNANENCDFLIEPCGGTSVSLEFTLFTFNDADDVVRVYDGEDANGIPLHTANGFSSNNIPPLNTPIVANSGKMYIQMVTDAFTQTTGFEANWTSTVVPLVPATAGYDADPNSSGVMDTLYTNVPAIIGNTSTGDQLEFEWDTDNDNFPDAFDENPTVIFGAPGIYPISLRAFNCSSEDTYRDSVVVVNPTLAPEVDFFADNLRPNLGEEVQLFEQIANGAETVEWSVSPATHTFVDPNTSRNPVVTFNLPGLYNIKLKATNQIGADSTEKIWYVEVIDHCDPLVFLTSADIGISNVMLENLDNTSAIGVDAYTDYSVLGVDAAELKFGGTYDLYVSRLTNFNNANRKAWIDFNKDGDFTDPGEMVLNEAADTTLTTKATFTVPALANAYEGSTKMRVSVAYESTPNTPCGPLVVGEVEDYGIVLGRDDVAPVITMLGSDTVFIEAGSTYIDAGATALDNLEGDITSDIVVDNQVDASQAGIYPVNYNVVDGSGNAAATVTRIVFVLVDLTPPVLTLNGANPMIVDVFTSFTDPGATAVDNYSGNLNNAIQVTGSVDTATVGTYTIKYRVEDAFGFADSAERIVEVVDQVAPIINPVVTDTFRVNVLTPFVDPVTVTDNYDLFVPSITTGGPVNTNALGTYVLTYNAFDASGNAATPYQLTVIVEDQTAPELTVDAADTVLVDAYANFTYPNATFSDNFSAVTFTRTGQVNVSLLGNYPVVYAAEDGSGNRTERTILVRVVDREAPVITVLGDNPTTWNRWVPYFEPNPAVQISDNYYSPSALYNILEIDTAENLKQGTGNTSLPGLFSVTYRVTDPSGNVAEAAVRLVSVVETVGLDEDAFGSYFSVYPNPTAGQVNVDIALIQAEDLKVEVFNIVGEQVQVLELTNVINDRIAINLSNEAEGVYHIRFSSDQNSTTKRVVVTK